MQISRRLVGITTLVISVFYILSDLIELVQSGFSSLQLYLTYGIFTFVPFVIMGLHLVQQPKVGWGSFIGALSYGVSFIFYAGTALYALVAQVDNYDLMAEQMGGFYLFHGILFVIGGIVFGTAALQAKVFPRWSVLGLIFSLSLSVVLFLFSAPEWVDVGNSILRNAAFIGMALSLFSDRSPIQ